MRHTNMFAYDELDIRIVLGSRPIRILCIRDSGDFRLDIGSHCHRDSYELHFIAEGRGSLHADGRSYPLEPGVFYLTGPGVYHEQKSDPLHPMREYGLRFEFMGRALPAMGGFTITREEERVIGALRDTRFWYGADEEGCLVLFERILDELRQKKLGYYMVIGYLIACVMLGCVRMYTGSPAADYAIPTKGPRSQKKKPVLPFMGISDAGSVR